jgi:GAF domain-containing protein/anti-sigma regulatory factor (Ser/Thr protein kinase)
VTGDELSALPAADLVAALDGADESWAVARAVREGGRIVDFELLFLNTAGAAAMGRPSGRRFSELWPGFVDDTLIEAVEDRKRLIRLYRDQEVRVHPVGDGFAVAFAAVGLQDATAALSRAASVEDVYEVMTRQVRPLADWQSLVVMLREGRRLTVTHATGLSPSALRNLRDVPLDDRYPMAAVVRTREPVFYGDSAAYLADFPERATQLAGAGQHAWAFVPLAAGGRAIGTMAIGYRQPRPFDRTERETLTALGALYAQAIERALSFEAQRSIAADLQHALLPTLPETPGARHAARYLPWTSGADVGGDWYDIIPLGPDSLGVMIGDVAGHSMTAAATMGQLRNAMRAYAIEGHSPTAVLERVNALLAHVEPEAIATCCYLELHLVEGTATAVLAGHLPPILRHRGGATPLQLRLGPPLGVVPRVAYVDTTVLVPPGSTLLLYTDGLVEDRRVAIAQGLAELCAALATAPADDPDALVEQVLAADVGPRPRADDVALLALAVDGLDRRPGGRVVDEVGAVRRFHGDASSAPAARRFAGDLLTAWGLTDLIDTTRLLLGEIITNAVQHTVGDVTVRLVRRPGRLRVEVGDGSERRPDLREVEPDSESGRGLRIVATLADAWGHDARESGGKIVWFELVI